MSQLSTSSYILANFETLFFKMGQARPLFVYFRFFQTQNLHKKLYALAGLELVSSE